MIQTDTVWKDTGYDCDHCGGRILRRTDSETGQSDRKCFQCEECGCQWSLAHRPLRVGTTPACRAAQRERAGKPEPADPYSRWLILALGIIVSFVLLRFGGGIVLRAALPVVAAAALLLILARYGRHRGWW